MEKIEDILKKITPTKTKNFKKREVLQQKGAITTQSFYVKKGLLRSYIIDSKGKEHIYMFAPEGWIIGDIEAIEFDEPAALYIDCLEDSEVIMFDKDCLFKADLPKDIIVENSKILYRRMGKLQRRVLMLLSAPAIDRYTYFLKTYPDLPHRIPQHMIATYLGITPQALSTIRGKIARSK